MKDSLKNIKAKTKIVTSLYKKNPKVTYAEAQTVLSANGFKYGLSPDKLKEIREKVLGVPAAKVSKPAQQQTEPQTETAVVPPFVAAQVDASLRTNNQALSETETESSPKEVLETTVAMRTNSSLMGLRKQVNIMSDKIGGLASGKDLTANTTALEVVGSVLNKLAQEVAKTNKSVGNATGSLYKLTKQVADLDKKLGTTGDAVNLSALRRDLDEVKKTLAEIQQIVGTPIVLGEIDTSKT